MISTTDSSPSSFTALIEDRTTTSSWAESSIDLSAYEGQKGYIAFRHYNCTGQYYIFLDDVTIEGGDIAAGEWVTLENVTSPADLEGLTPSTQYEVQVQGVYADGTSQWTESTLFTTSDGLDMPTDLAVADITDNSAVASWEGIQDTYNLRYRKAYTADVNFFEGFEDGLDAWTLVDSDGDGNNWQLADPETTFSNEALPRFEGTQCVMSRSYSGTALTPDQWMISPEIEDLGGMLRYYVMDDGADYPETYRIYINTTGSTDIADFVPVTEDMLTPNALAWTEQSVDLSAYAGQSGRIAFRHYNCTDKDFMFIDAIGIYTNEVPAGEWTVLENVTSPADIEGLDPETEYEVQVQGILGQNTTEWTESVLFTTLEAPVIPEYNEFYVVGTFNGWNQTEEGGRITLVANEEGTEFTGTVELEAGAEFKVVTYTAASDTIWFGGEDANQAGFFLVNSDMLGRNISLIDGANFRVEEGGEYNITVMAYPESKGISEPLAMVITKTQTGISTIGVDGYDNNAWYNLNGQKLSGKPTVPGIYINGNKKVIIK